MSTIPGYTTRRGWQAIATWRGGSAIIARGPRLWCQLRAYLHRLTHPARRVRVEPIP